MFIVNLFIISHFDGVVYTFSEIFYLKVREMSKRIIDPECGRSIAVFPVMVNLRYVIIFIQTVQQKSHELDIVFVLKCHIVGRNFGGFGRGDLVSLFFQGIGDRINIVRFRVNLKSVTLSREVGSARLQRVFHQLVLINVLVFIVHHNQTLV